MSAIEAEIMRIMMNAFRPTPTLNSNNKGRRTANDQRTRVGGGLVGWLPK